MPDLNFDFYFYAAHVPMIQCDHSGKIIAFNNIWLRLSGLTESEARHREVRDLLMPSSLATFEAMLKTASHDNEPALQTLSCESNLDFKTAGRGEFTLIISWGFSRDSNHNRILHIIGRDPELHHKQVTFSRLLESEAKTRTLLESLPDLLFVLDRAGTYLEVYASKPEKLLRPAAELRGHNIFEFLPDDVYKQCSDAIETVCREQRMETFEYSLNFDNETSHFEGRVVPYGANVMFLVRDISEMRRAERRLREQQALIVTSNLLASLGEMAAGIAHEINNPLQIIHYNALLIRDALTRAGAEWQSTAQAASKIETTVLRISNIITGLKGMSRDGSGDQFVTTPVVDIIDDTVDLFREKFRHLGIRFEASIATLAMTKEAVYGDSKMTSAEIESSIEALAVECRSVQICQVLMNLLLNAQDAVSAMAREDRWIKMRVSEHDTLVEFRVSDSGPSIAPEIRARLFDPFFTTKAPGKGTGLGLSVSANIIENHFGSIYLDDTPGPTAFVIKLPKQHWTRPLAT